jgi:flagellar protein FlgJ
MNFAIATTPQAATDTATAARHRKLTDAAQQFEGMLLQEMLKPMKEHGFSGDADSGSDDDGKGGSFGDTLSSFGSETMATSIAKSGGLGIAASIVKQVERQTSIHAQPANAPSSLNIPK